ncbi:AAA family ATPase [Vulcanisaeta sp. JCM 16161]|uniref:AAA family ATPase n=1 Tax=Vulcanisaeta sp. JCM 16161 TaxID=1295372 RepID=UPI0006D19ABB|nr:AAA family ATPase [Vulcanisaeta sp. JCM 16161]
MRRLTIRNIGPISKADIEITPWVIIVGGNASGKTIISTIHYLTLFQSAPSMPWRINLGTIRAGVQETSISVKELIEENRELFKQLLTNEIRRLFNAEPHGLVKIGEDEGRIEVITDSLVLSVIIDRRGNAVGFDVNGDRKLSVIIEYAKSNYTQCISSGVVEDGQYRVSVMGSNTDCAAHIIGSYVLSRAFGDTWSPAAFLATERIAILALHPGIMRLILTPEPVTISKPLPLLMDFLRWIAPGEYREELSGLTITYQPSAITIRSGGGNIPPSLVSTGIYQAFAIEAVARNPIVRTMIIEEPEINLHADAEIRMVRYLASIRDKNMFVTTHSEWMVMGIAHELNRQGRLKDLRIYEIRNGNVVEVPIGKNGEVEALETITPVREEYLREIIEEVLSNEQGNNH